MKNINLFNKLQELNIYNIPCLNNIQNIFVIKTSSKVLNVRAEFLQAMQDKAWGIYK